jgi:pimeloyl-ACP methyl ester carboxylesterase
MTEIATWFGPPERPLFGFAHIPDGDIRGGIALCPPIGYEYICSHRTFRVLAERLAADGFLTLRFDYDGTGDSVGDSLDSDRLAAWRASIGYALSFLRTAGAPAIGAVGMRIGATLASIVANDCQALVLWDPVLSGKGFLHEQRALQKVALGDAAETPPEGSVLYLVGAEYTAETVDALEQLELTQPGHDTPVLALLRNDRPRQRIGKRLAGWSNVSVRDADGQDLLLDKESSTALVPRQTVGEIADWLGSTMPDKLVAAGDPLWRSEARLPANEAEITERLVKLGPFDLFGIVSEQGAIPGRPTLVCLNNAVGHHIGPARLWVEWGRAMAAQGWRVVRFDLAGIGDSPARPGQPIDRSFPTYADSDIASVCEEFRSDGVVVIGLCSGGLHAMDIGPNVPARGVVVLNAALHEPRRFRSLISLDNPNPPGLVRINNQRVRGRLHQLVPGPVWRALSAVGRGPENPRILKGLVARGVDILMVYGSDDYDLWKARQSMRWILDSLSRRSKLTVVKVPGLDHGALQTGPRRAAAEVLSSYISERFGDRTEASTTRSQSVLQYNSAGPARKLSSDH